MGSATNCREVEAERTVDQRNSKRQRRCNVASGITNVYLGIKKQHVKGLYDNFNTQKAEFEEFKARHEAGQIKPGEAFHFKADLEYLSPVNVPIGPLQTQVFEKISVTGRPLALAGALGQSITALHEMMEMRNNLILSIRPQKLSSDELSVFYFGLPTARRVDQTYFSTLEGTVKYIDDCIHFSKLLAIDLSRHGNRVKERFQKRFRGPAPTVVSFDFSKPEKDGLMPPPENYADWESMFVFSPAPERGMRAAVNRFTARLRKTFNRPSNPQP